MLGKETEGRRLTGSVCNFIFSDQRSRHVTSSHLGRKKRLDEIGVGRRGRTREGKEKEKREKDEKGYNMKVNQEVVAGLTVNSRIAL